MGAGRTGAGERHCIITAYLKQVFPVDNSKAIGNCHCGAIVIEVDLPRAIEVHECNCSMCTRTGFLHVIVSKSAFTLIKGNDDLTTYTFNTGVAKHYFCRHCGCKPFYVPRSNPDGFSVNLRCLDQSYFTAITVIPFDGQNWEQQGATLAHLSQ